MGVIGSLLPIFILIGLGAVLTARGFLTTASLRQLSRLAYYVGMPGLLFVHVSTAARIDERPLRISIVLLAASVAALLIGYAAGRLLRLPAAGMGTFVQSCFRSNLAFVGLPVVLHVAGLPGAPAGAGELAPLIAVAIAPVMIAYNVLSVFVLVASHEKITAASLRTIARQVATNPLVLAIAAGMLAARAELEIPPAIASTLHTVGGLAIPAALLGVGGTAATAPVRAHLRTALTAGLIKTVVMPAIGLALARAWQLPPLDAALATMLCATPTAAAAFIMSVQLRGDGAIAASAIAASTLLSAGTLAAALALLPG